MLAATPQAPPLADAGELGLRVALSVGELPEEYYQVRSSGRFNICAVIVYIKGWCAVLSAVSRGAA